MTGRYIVALDQGTTSSRAILFDEKGNVVAKAQEEIRQIYPQPGWVEHDPADILKTQLNCVRAVIREASLTPGQITALAVTNQRETTVVWDRQTGRPVCNAIVWQDKRTAPLCEQLRQDGLEEYIRTATGLVIDSYFSATKLKWILDNVPGCRQRAENGELAFGTIDSWLIWNLTGGRSHVTDFTNASRTMLFNIEKLEWDEIMLGHLSIPASMLPSVLPCSAHFGDLLIDGESIPILGVAGDQHAALFGQMCFEPGMVKNTYGTGCFMLMNIGDRIQWSDRGLITTIAWGIDGKVEYALEGSVFIAGAAVQWLRDSLHLIDESSDSEYFASKALGSNEVYVVPAFAGLGAPYWDMYARGAIFGLTRDTGKEHIIKATLESLAFQTKDILDAMEQDARVSLGCLRVDGGASANNMLMQFQADILGKVVERPVSLEITAAGAAYFAGLQAGIWTKSDLPSQRQIERKFVPSGDRATADALYRGWQKAVSRTMGWLEK